MKKMMVHLSMDYANSVWQPILNIKLIYKMWICRHKSSLKKKMYLNFQYVIVNQDALCL